MREGDGPGQHQTFVTLYLTENGKTFGPLIGRSGEGGHTEAGAQAPASAFRRDSSWRR